MGRKGQGKWGRANQKFPRWQYQVGAESWKEKSKGKKIPERPWIMDTPRDNKAHKSSFCYFFSKTALLGGERGVQLKRVVREGTLDAHCFGHVWKPRGWILAKRLTCFLSSSSTLFSAELKSKTAAGVFRLPRQGSSGVWDGERESLPRSTTASGAALTGTRTAKLGDERGSWVTLTQQTPARSLQEFRNAAGADRRHHQGEPTAQSLHRSQ